MTNRDKSGAHNLVRGVIAFARDHRFVKDKDPRKHSENIRIRLRDAYLTARHTLPNSEHSSFLTWSTTQLGKMVPELNRLPIGYDSLAGVDKRRNFLNWSSEFDWACSILIHHAATINKFISCSRECERYIIKGNYEEAIQELVLLESELGASFWSVQLRIALEHQAGGLERQKKYTAQVRAVYKTGLLGFISYQTSVRNEERTSLTRYVDDVTARIDAHRFYDTPIKDFVKLKLLGQLPNDNNRLANVLYISQSHSIIDVYETLMSIMQFRCADAANPLNASELISIRELVNKINDFRLTSLIQSSALDKTSLLLPASVSADLLFESKFLRAGFSASRSLKSGDANAWTVLYGAAALSSAKVRPVTSHSPNVIVRIVTSILSRTGEPDLIDQALKLCLNFRGASTFAGISTALQQLGPTLDYKKFQPWQISLNAPLSNVSKYFSFNSAHPSTPHGPQSQLMRAWDHVRSADFTNALEILESPPLRSAAHEPLTSLRDSLRLISYWYIGDRPKVISITASIGSKSDAHRKMIPVRKLLENYVWNDYKSSVNRLAPSCALHMLWLEDEEDYTLTQLRFAVGQFLRLTKIGPPSNLFDEAENYERKELIYFLRWVCVQNVLDQSRVVKGSIAVKTERQAICAGLRSLDPDNSDLYEDEVFLITNQLALHEGRLLVDRTRIYVDSDALTRWAKKDLLEEYQRYRDLLKVELPSAQEFDEIMRKVLSPTAGSTGGFVPDDEADLLLADLLQKLTNEFLNNSSYGLDYYLSKRVRHQSFVGLIRGPLESTQLITTRESETGPYHQNETWVRSFGQATNGAQQKLFNAFLNFPAKFDDILTSARDKKFQIRSKEHPEGLLHLQLSPQFILLARTVARSDLTVEDFVRTTVSLFWGALTPSLSIAQNYIAEDMSVRIAVAFEELRAAVKNIAEDDPSYLSFKLAVNKAAEEVQRSLDEAAKWFLRTDDDVKRKLFSTDQIVKIALDAALKCQRGFDPKIDVNVSETELQLMATSLVFVHDVIFVALDNTKAHSGIRSPKILVHVKPNIDTETLTVEVESEFRAPNRSANERKLDEIRTLIDSGGYTKKTKVEGGTGFFKLAATVRQSEKGRLEFGFNAAGDFRLAVTYSMLVQKGMEVIDESIAS